jgi:WD40 repeat protein
MPLKFEDKYQSVQLNTPEITSLDFSNDGTLLAVSFFSARASDNISCIHVYSTADGSKVGEYGAGSGRGVVFSGDGMRLYFLVQTEHGQVELQSVPISGSAPERLSTYGGSEIIHSIRRDQSCSLFCVVGNATEIWNASRGEVVRFIESDFPNQRLNVWLNQQGTHLYAYALHESEVTRIDTSTNVEIEHWKAPKPNGQQVVVSPSERYLVAVGAGNTGVYIYDLETNMRYDSFMYDDLTFTQLFLFSHDSSTLISREGPLYAQPLSGGIPITGPELINGITTAAAASWAAPIIGYGINDCVFWIRLKEEEQT